MSARVSASTFTAAAQHPTLPPGYAYFYGGVGGMPGLAGYGNMGATQQLQYPGIPVPTAAGNTSTTQFQNKAAYGSRYTYLQILLYSRFLFNVSKNFNFDLSHTY